MERFSEDFLADVDEYVHHVQTAVENDVGRCGPVSTIYNATTSAVCKDIMYPFVSISSYPVNLLILGSSESLSLNV